MKYLFASDLDGTLYNFAHMTDGFILRSIQKVLKHGHSFTIATGRNMHKAQVKAGFKNVKVNVVCMNGARVLDSEFQVIYEQCIDKKCVAELIEQFPEVRLEFFAANCTYVFCSEEEFKKSAYRPKWYVRMVKKLFSDRYVMDYVFDATPEIVLNKDIFKINFNLPEGNTRIRMEQYLQEHKSELINAPFRAGDYFELTEASVNKGRSIQILAEHLGIDEDHVQVYGDGYNDLVMLRQFKHAFVPSNGCDEAKALAEQVIGRNVLYSVPRHILQTIKK